MRNATVYGVSPRLRLDIVLNNLVGWAHTTGAIRLQSDGTAWRPLVHVKDIAAAAIALLDAPTEVVRAEAYNVGSAAQNYRIRELAEVVRDVMPECDVTYADGVGSDPRSYRVDFGKLERAFPDLVVRWTARLGAEELLASYREGRLTSADFEGRRFVRLRQLKYLIELGKLDGELRPSTEPC